MEKGREEGKNLKAIQIAKKLLESGMDVDTVMKMTDLSKSEIEIKFCHKKNNIFDIYITFAKYFEQATSICRTTMYVNNARLRIEENEKDQTKNYLMGGNKHHC